MCVNQKLVLLGFSIVLFLGIIGPQVYFDFRVESCIEAELNQAKAYGKNNDEHEWAIINNLCTIRVIGAIR